MNFPLRHQGTFTEFSILTSGSLWTDFHLSDDISEMASAIEQSPPETAKKGVVNQRASGTIVPIHNIKDRTKSRFRLLRRLKDNHDNEGASAADKKSVDTAIAFIDTLSQYPEFYATLDDDGSAVIEFEDKDAGFFADIKFNSDGTVESYRRLTGLRSVTFTGNMESEAARQFLEQELRIVLL